MYASAAVHSALLVGFDKANTMGLSLNSAMSFKMLASNNPPCADAPIKTFSGKKTENNI